jgi:hypothetical protein
MTSPLTAAIMLVASLTGTGARWGARGGGEAANNGNATKTGAKARKRRNGILAKPFRCATADLTSTRSLKHPS